MYFQVVQRRQLKFLRLSEGQDMNQKRPKFEIREMQTVKPSNDRQDLDIIKGAR